MHLFCISSASQQHIPTQPSAPSLQPVNNPHRPVQTVQPQVTNISFYQVINSYYHPTILITLRLEMAF